MRYKLGRAMMRFDEDYFRHLKGFKSGFSGNELRIIKDVLARKFEHLPGTRHILDVGSGDGVWIQKMIEFLDVLDTSIRYTALEPIANDELERTALRHGIELRTECIEDYNGLQNEFDAILSTQSVYYYANEGWAHSNILRVLKDDGIYVVTLASDACILHQVTELLIGGALQKVFTAESYLRHVAKLGLFDIVEVHPYEGQFDCEHYVKNDAALISLAHVLSRHRLPTDQLNAKIDGLRAFLRSKGVNRKRVNRVIVLRKRTNSNETAENEMHLLETPSRKVFISYSSKQKAHANNLHYMLRQAGFEPTLDSFDIKAGQKLTDRISSLIKDCDFFVLLISNDSIQSKWVQTELTLADSLGMIRDERLLPVQVESVDSAAANSLIQIPRNSYNWMDASGGMHIVIDRLNELTQKVPNKPSNPSGGSGDY